MLASKMLDLAFFAQELAVFLSVRLDLGLTMREEVADFVELVEPC